MGEVTVLYFAAARERAGCSREVLANVSAPTARALLERLVELCTPRSARSCRTCGSR